VCKHLEHSYVTNTRLCSRIISTFNQVGSLLDLLINWLNLLCAAAHSTGMKTIKKQHPNVSSRMCGSNCWSESLRFPGCHLLHVNRWPNIEVCLEVRWILNILKQQHWRFSSSGMWHSVIGCVVPVFQRVVPPSSSGSGILVRLFALKIKHYDILLGLFEDKSTNDHSKRREPHTQWQSITSQKNYTAEPLWEPQISQ
jgi:hypothetical protein